MTASPSTANDRVIWISMSCNRIWRPRMPDKRTLTRIMGDACTYHVHIDHAHTNDFFFLNILWTRRSLWPITSDSILRNSIDTIGRKSKTNHVVSSNVYITRSRAPIAFITFHYCESKREMRGRGQREREGYMMMMRIQIESTKWYYYQI